MRLEHEGRVSAPRARVWGVLMDLPRAARLVPGMGPVEPTGEGRWRGSLRVQVGPVRLELAGDVQLIECDDAAGTAALRLDAADARLGGAVRARVDLTASELAGGATLVRMITDAQVLGRIGELGQPLIKRKADQIVGRFLDDLGPEVAS